MEKILIVEDDRTIHKALRLLFEAEGYPLEFVTDGESALASFKAAPPGLVILDLRLPKMPGRQVCLEMKKAAPALPIIILTANAEETDKILLLELGADDYVTKPFSPKELLARTHAVLRRAKPGTKVADQYSFADISIDFAKMELKRAGKLIEMTPREFKILKYFALNPERVISRDELLSEVWGYNCYPSTRTVDNHILKLRQKLEKEPDEPAHFRTVHGAGYKFVPSIAK